MNSEDNQRKITFYKFKNIRQGGFTLIEILIVVAVLGILAAIIIPNVGNITSTANVTTANTEIQNVRIAALAYKGDTDQWPVDTNTAGFSDYIAGELRATYFFNHEGQITRVDTSGAADPWPLTIDFDVETQQWEKTETVATSPTVISTIAATTIPTTEAEPPTESVIPVTTLPATKTVTPTTIIEPTTIPVTETVVPTKTVEPTKTIAPKTTTPVTKTIGPTKTAEPETTKVTKTTPTKQPVKPADPFEP
jgi:prepilin-type N-terminal cleavage/methylation domain-containing protein